MRRENCKLPNCKLQILPGIIKSLWPKNYRRGFSTTAIHAGQEPEPLTGAVSFPIFATSTYVQDELGKPRLGYEYARVTNPTRDRLQESLAALEGGAASRVFASGMAAINAICTMMKAGDHLVCSDNVYGGVPRLFNQILANYGLEFTYVDTSDLRAVEKAIQKNTRYVYVETPTNPLMTISDLAAICDLAHRRRAEVIVDNTFMSPFFQRPIELGADMVVHSTTKFLNGHSDGLGGVVVCTTNEQAEQLAFIQKSAGAIMSPFECWLVLRGVKTLGVRMQRHDENGRRIAEYLAGHKKVKAVFYPGLHNHPQHDLAKRQMSGFGSMITLRNRLARQRQAHAEEIQGHAVVGRVARRGRDPDLAPGDHDPRRARREGKTRHRHHRRHGAHFGGHRGRGGHHRGSWTVCLSAPI